MTQIITAEMIIELMIFALVFSLPFYVYILLKLAKADREAFTFFAKGDKTIEDFSPYIKING